MSTPDPLDRFVLHAEDVTITPPPANHMQQDTIEGEGS